MEIQDYDNFFLSSTNLEESRKFYQQTLGLQLKFDFSEKGMVAFKVGNNEPAIILKDVAKFPAAKPAIWFKVESVTEAYKEMAEKGIVFLSAPYKIQTGWAVEFTDPSGNVLGLTDYTAWH